MHWDQTTRRGSRIVLHMFRFSLYRWWWAKLLTIINTSALLTNANVEDPPKWTLAPASKREDLPLQRRFRT